MRTEAEIIKRISEVKENDFFGFETTDLLACLSFKAAKPFLKKGAKADGWEPEPRDAESLKARIVKYLEFAWEKAVDHRGLSASRSISHFRAWLWLLGDDVALDFASDESKYTPYGAPVLAFLSERFGHRRPADEMANNMAAGRPCSHDCGGCTS
jgi:hypothetical protein